MVDDVEVPEATNELIIEGDEPAGKDALVDLRSSISAVHTKDGARNFSLVEDQCTVRVEFAYPS